MNRNALVVHLGLGGYLCNALVHCNGGSRKNPFVGFNLGHFQSLGYKFLWRIQNNNISMERSQQVSKLTFSVAYK